MDILAVTQQIPATPDMPGSPRMFHLCRALSRQHRIHLAVTGNSLDRLAQFRSHPETSGIFAEVAALPAPPPATWRHRQSHRLHLACHLSTRHSHPAYHAEISSWIRARLEALPPPRLVYVDGLAMTQYIRRDDRTPALADLHDSLALLYRQNAAQESRFRARLALRLEQWALARWERSLGSVCDVVVVNSAVDEAFLRSMAPRLPTLTITNGVDTAYFARGHAPVHPPRLVFTGVMDYGPNEDAVRYFCSAIFPTIRTSFPEAQFWAVGANPPATLLGLAAGSDIAITGTVKDIRPYLREAAVFVCPLRYGTGIKNKLLSAMAVGTPIVCTSVATRGIDVRPEEHLLVADTPPEFSRQVCRVLADPGLARRLAQAAHERVLERYSWASHGRRLEDVVRTLSERAAVR